MKLKVLVDNNTYIDCYYYGEPGVCFFIEDEETKLLFDLGYSGLFIKNARAFNINLTEISSIVISHGHDDHTGGFKYLFEHYNMPCVKVIAHPHSFNEKVIKDLRICSPITENELTKRCKLILSRTPVKISNNLYFLGEIPVSNDFEIRKPIGKQKANNKFTDDFVLDDTALVYKSIEGLYVITGCSHSGICNIIEYAKTVCGDNRVISVIGGFHLFDISPRLHKTIEYFKENNINEIYPCHCVSFKAKAEIHKSIYVHEVGVGMEICW